VGRKNLAEGGRWATGVGVLMMQKFFNTSGPIKSDKHYSQDPLSRLDWQEIRHLIDSERYFVLHAPRQTGKTSALLAMMKTLNEAGDYACAYANIEGAQAARGDETQGVPAICDAIVQSIEIYLGKSDLSAWYKTAKREFNAQSLLTALLKQWSEMSAKPTVLLLDEVDALVGDTLISLLRQIRAGYAQRPEAFPQSIILCGVRDVRDYRLHMSDGEVITGGSAFNIKAESLRMGNFSQTETIALLQQHTAATGQVFEAGVLDALWLDSKGQPWLVNALAHQMTWHNRAARDRTQPITQEQYTAAREKLIYSRATHLDQLIDKLREPRVHSVISAMLEGDEELIQINPHDIEYVQDLGLIDVSRTSGIKISNRIYQEVIPRELVWATQMMISNQEQSWYITPDRHIDTPKLLVAFQQFFREHSDHWIEGFNYKEAGPQLLIQAFLQRIINGGGRINREYALGRKRTDLLIEWPLNEQEGFLGPVQRIVLELKLWRKGRNFEKLLQEGVMQTRGYAAQVGADEAHLIIFDRHPERAWDEKIWQKVVDGLPVWGC
jgi:type II secretory pathway predicted ATPase ExeA